jgi:hypothetical protein
MITCIAVFASLLYIFSAKIDRAITGLTVAQYKFREAVRTNEFWKNHLTASYFLIASDRWEAKSFDVLCTKSPDELKEIFGSSSPDLRWLEYFGILASSQGHRIYLNTLRSAKLENAVNAVGLYIFNAWLGTKPSAVDNVKRLMDDLSRYVNADNYAWETAEAEYTDMLPALSSAQIAFANQDAALEFVRGNKLSIMSSKCCRNAVSILTGMEAAFYRMPDNNPARKSKQLLLMFGMSKFLARMSDLVANKRTPIEHEVGDSTDTTGLEWSEWVAPA